MEMDYAITALVSAFAGLGIGMAVWKLCHRYL